MLQNQSAAVSRMSATPTMTVVDKVAVTMTLRTCELP